MEGEAWELAVSGIKGPAPSLEVEGLPQVPTVLTTHPPRHPPQRPDEPSQTSRKALERAKDRALVPTPAWWSARRFW